MEKTLVLIKPDATKRGIIGDVLRLYEVNALKIENLKMLVPTEALLRVHYVEHLERSFYKELEAFMMSGPVVAAVISGPGAVDAVRELHGDTDPAKARFGTVRHMYGTTVQMNTVHGSSDLEAAAREVAIWFGN